MLKMDYPFKKEILACGAEQQAGFCLTKKNCAFIISDLGNLAEHSALEHYQQEIERLEKELKIKPKVITYDLHPEYSSTKYAQALSKKRKHTTSFAVQHHQAHIASCLAENAIANKVIAVVFDNGALGEDGQIWGGEFFVGSLKGFERVAHLKYTALLNPKEITQAWLQAISFLDQAFSQGLGELGIEFIRRHQADNWHQLKQDLQNSIYSSSMARFFDAISALVGLRERLEYEGQGIMELERIVNRSSHVAGKIYQFGLQQQNGKLIISPEPILQNIVDDLRKNISKSIISAAFHNTIIEIIRSICDKISRREKIKDVVLTGAVFQNKFLLKQVKGILDNEGFTVITHRHFSYNDSNIAFGQAVLADAK